MYSNSAAFTCFDFSGFSYIYTQKNIQMKPSAPMMMKAISQPIAWARMGIVSGAANAPTEAPALKSDVAKARSFLGKYSAVTLIAAGKLPASPRARMARHTRKSHTLKAAAAIAASEPFSSAFRASIDSWP